MHNIDLSPSNRVETIPNKFWEVLENDGLVITKRSRVPGGWLVQQFFTAPRVIENSQLGNIQFVADPYHEWYIKLNYSS